jgi:alkanesulfonate monooxygenase SsuD/methylene tetrahydromethanopterin reductase-like flavin-dependent oxidoreductase (luciferase family)
VGAPNSNGYIQQEFDALGVPLAERAPRTEDAIEVCRRAWTEGTVTYDGHRFSCEDVRVEPKPVQDGGPPILLGGMSAPAVDRAAELADGHIGVIYYPDEWSDRFTYRNFERNVDRIHDRRAAESFSVAAVQYAHVAETDEAAWEELRPHLVYSRRKYAEHMADGDPEQWDEDALEPDRLAALRAGALVGSPDTVVERLKRLQRSTPGELHVIARMWHPNMTLDQHLDQLETFSDQVISRF